MKRSKWDGIAFRKELRTQSEAMVANLAPDNDVTAQPVEVLMHELLVNRIELELQNEELRRANIALTEANDRYLELYELAPVGYLTLNRANVIGDINLAGALMLGVNRNELVGRHFAEFVGAGDSDRWHCQFQTLIEQPHGEKRALRLEMKRRNESNFSAYLDCCCEASSEETPVLRLTMVDVSKITLLE